MAHVENILNGRVFVSTVSSGSTPSEKEVIQEILSQENLGDMILCDVIKNGENYDSFCVATKNANYLVRLSFDNELIFETENIVLQQLANANLEIAPRFIAHGFLDNIQYQITTFERAKNAENMGGSAVLINYKPFICSIREIHKLNLSAPTFSDKLKKIFAATDFSSNQEFQELVKANSENYQLLNEGVLETKQYIEDHFKDYMEESTPIHFNLSGETILFGEDRFKFVSWFDSCLGNPMIELARLKFNLFLDQNIEHKFFHEYNAFAVRYSWEEYIYIRNFIAALELLENTFAYTKEIFLYDSRRQKEMLKLFSRFCKNSKHFDAIPVFRKNKDRIIKLFSDPIL